MGYGRQTKDNHSAKACSEAKQKRQSSSQLCQKPSKAALSGSSHGTGYSSVARTTAVCQSVNFLVLYAAFALENVFVRNSA